MKEVQEEPNKLRDIPCSKIGRFNIVKKSLLDKLMYKLNIILIKIPERFCVDIGKIVLKSLWRSKGARMANIILKKKNKVEAFSLPGFKTYYMVIIISMELAEL